MAAETTGVGDDAKKHLAKLSAAVLEGNPEAAKEAALELKQDGIAPQEIVNLGIKPAMDEVGRRYDRLEAFLPELVMAGDSAQEALKVLFTKEGRDALAKGKIVIGTIYGDIHDIGKNIAAAILSANGYQVVDLGNDAPADKFVETAKSEGADIIGISCLLTPSMYFMKDVIRRLKDEGIRDRFKVIVGGASIYPDWAREIGADGWAKDAERAVQLCDMLLGGSNNELPLIVGEWK